MFRSTSASMQEATGLKFCSNQYEFRTLFDEIYIEGQYAIDWELLPERPVVLDVGANVGIFASLVLSHRPHARVLCVEAAPALVDILTRNFADSTGVSVIAAAISEHEGIEQFSYFPNCTMLSGIGVTPKSVSERVQENLTEWAEQNGFPTRSAAEFAIRSADTRSQVEQIMLPTTTVGRLVEQFDLSRVDILKIDIEGGELPVLRSLDAATWEMINTVAVEPQLVADELSELRSLLENRSYGPTGAQRKLDLGASMTYSRINSNDY